MKSLKEIQIGVYHHGCWGSKSSEKFPETVSTLRGPCMLEQKGDLTRVTSTMDTSFISKKQRDEYIEYAKVHPEMKSVKVLYKTNTRAIINVSYEGGSSYGAVLHNKVAYTGPISQEKSGYEMHPVLTKNPKEVTRLLRELNTLGEVKIFKVKNFEKKDFSPLTDKQRQALKIAKFYGYYSWPRHVTLEELAEKADTTRRAFQENLRKAEAKIFPDFLREKLEL